MKTLFVFFLMFIFAHNLLAVDTVKGSMAILTDGIADAKQKDSSIVFDILTGKIVGTENIKGNIFYYDNEKEAVEKFIHHDVDYVMMNPLFYLKNQKILDKNSLDFWSVRHYKEKCQKMIIIVKKSSKIQSITDLKDKRVAIKEDNYLGKIVLQKAFYEKKQIQTEGYIKKFVLYSRHSTAILKTFFGKSDAAIVPVAAFDIVCEMNPKVKQSIKVIYSTDRIFIPVISLINKNTDVVLVEKLKKLLNNMKYTADGQSMFSFFKIQGVDMIQLKELDNLKHFYHEYLLLEKKYGGKR